ncbi:MAG: hypothetical protein ACR2O0_13270 [Rhizobiaceae bacterium]
MAVTMEYAVQTEPDGRQYNVTAIIIGNDVAMYCDCLAGKTGQFCKHRRSLLEDDETLIINSSSHPVEQLRGVVKRSALGRSFDRLLHSEKLLERAQQLNSDEKAMLAKLANTKLDATEDQMAVETESQ